MRLLERVPFAPWCLARHIADARARLDDRSFAEAWTEGHTLMTAAGSRSEGENTLRELSIVTGALIARRPAGLGAACRLTPRERDVLRLVASGLTNAAVASNLVISPLTVNAHLRSIYRKLEVKTRSGATRQAVMLGLV